MRPLLSESHTCRSRIAARNQRGSAGCRSNTRPGRPRWDVAGRLQDTAGRGHFQRAIERLGHTGDCHLASTECTQHAARAHSFSARSRWRRRSKRASSECSAQALRRKGGSVASFSATCDDVIRGPNKTENGVVRAFLISLFYSFARSFSPSRCTHVSNSFSFFATEVCIDAARRMRAPHALFAVCSTELGAQFVSRLAHALRAIRAIN